MQVFIPEMKYIDKLHVNLTKKFKYRKYLI